MPVETDLKFNPVKGGNPTKLLILKDVLMESRPQSRYVCILLVLSVFSELQHVPKIREIWFLPMPSTLHLKL